MIRLATLTLAIYWVTIFVATHLPSAVMPQLEWTDKFYHFGGFAGLAFLMAWAFPSIPRNRQALLVVAIGFTYAFLDEYTQGFVAGRTCDVYDMVADAVGILIGLGVYFVARRVLVNSEHGKQLIQNLSISLFNS